ncbi:MAG TPA: efflux RND transporter periplasmic adaptor subunit [Bryobacteraceae bacterium]|nr:efflux RND transporter periplasmic adaptor subunit [Bryobacteraceae bacterium]
MPFRPVIGLSICAVLALALAGCKQQEVHSMAAGPPVVPVSVAKVSEESVPTELRVVGTVDASSVVQIKSQIAGQLDKVDFTEGQNIRKGDLLFVIDPRPYQDALQQAEAAVARDRAQIAQSQASLARDAAQAKYAQTDAARNAELQKEGLMSQSQFDQSRNAADVSRETMRATSASIDSAKAALDADVAAAAAAKLNLSYCEIRAPISGRAGNLLVHAGNLVKVNDVALVILHQVEPIYVNFSVPEQHLSAIRRLQAAHPLEVQVFTEDDPNRAVTGHLSVIDNTVDSTTGTIHLKGVFDNHDRRLWPGQFVTVLLTLDTIRNATVVPAEAVQNAQQGQFVYVVKPDHKVELRMLTLGRAFGRTFVVEKGLTPGETVVTDGQLRLFPGAEVKPVESPKSIAGQP